MQSTSEPHPPLSLGAAPISSQLAGDQVPWHPPLRQTDTQQDVVHIAGFKIIDALRSAGLVGPECEESGADLDEPLEGFQDQGFDAELAVDKGAGLMSRADASEEVPAQSTPTAGGKSQSRRQKAKSKAKRKEKRKQVKLEHGGHPDPTFCQQHVRSACPLAPDLYSVKSMPSAKTGYVGLKGEGSNEAIFALESLLASGFTKVEWDGRSPMPLVDDEGYVFGLLGGQLNDPTRPALMSSIATELEKVRVTHPWGRKDASERRGDFIALNTGIGAGQGTGAALNLRVDRRYKGDVHRLFEMDAIRRVAGFSNGLFKTWAPKLHALYQATMGALLEHEPSLVQNFDSGAWATCAFNLGPRTVCCMHRDFRNLPHGWCCVTSFGNFDANAGGHLVLYELKLVVRFPAGSTVLIPSAAITHGNTPIAEGERQYSITQYTPGGIFRWVDCGFQTMGEYESKIRSADWAEEIERRMARATRGAKLFSTLPELLKEA